MLDPLISKTKVGDLIECAISVTERGKFRVMLVEDDHIVMRQLDAAEKDLQRTMAVINRKMPNFDHYGGDRCAS